MALRRRAGGWKGPEAIQSLLGKEDSFPRMTFLVGR